MTGVSPVPRIVVAARLELVAELAEVVELAVEDGDDVAVLVRDRLAARGEVDDPQPPVAEHAAAEGVDRALVGAAVDDRVVHARRRPPRRRSPAGAGIRRSRTRMAKRYAVVSCHVERPLDDDCWRRFSAFQARGPAGSRSPR